MRRVLAEFVPPKKLPNVVWRILGVALALSAAALWLTTRQLAAAEQELERQRDSLRATRDRLAQEQQLSLSGTQATRPFETSAREWEAERRAPLADAMRVIERVKIPDVIVRSLEMSGQPQTVRLGIRAGAHEAAVQFARALNDGTMPMQAGVLHWRLVRSDALPDGGGVQALLEASRQ